MIRVSGMDSRIGATFDPDRLFDVLKRPNPRPLDLKGVVMEVLGPKCNERSTTLRWSVLGLHMGWLDRAVTPTARSTAAGLATPRKKKHD